MVDLKHQQIGNIKTVEAQAILSTVRELGMTWELDQQNIIDKIKEMEERDLKEADKLGVRSKNQ